MRQWPGIGTVMVGKQRAGRVYGAVGVCGHSLSIDFFSCKIRRKEGLPWWLRGSACNAADPDSIPGSGRSPGEGNGYPLQYSCLENSMDRGAWQATVHDIAKSRTQLSD